MSDKSTARKGKGTDKADKAEPVILSTTAQAVKTALPDLPDGTHVTSLSDFGYKVAKYGDVGISYGDWAARNIPGFPDNVSDEVKAEVFAGFIHRKADLMAADGTSRRYLREGTDNFRPVPADDTSADTIEIGVAYAMAYSSQQFGSLRKAQPNLHRLVKTVRDEVNKYCSNRWNYLINLYKAGHKTARDRSVNKTFTEFLDATMESIVKRNKTALAGGDTTAVAKTVLDLAIAAFRKALDTKPATPTA